MRALLDTHVFLWFIFSDSRIQQSWIDVVENPLSEVYLSIGSLWEIAIKSSIGKLTLEPSIDQIVQDHVLARGLKVLPVTIPHIMAVQGLPHHHRDPFDRLIIAQSIIEKLPIITSDSQFDKYDIPRVF
jgi:PIN domain nuclease of toxin-antitoxin system